MRPHAVFGETLYPKLSFAPLLLKMVLVLASFEYPLRTAVFADPEAVFKPLDEKL